MSKTNEGFKHILSAVTKILPSNMAEIENVEVEFPVLCHLVGGEF